ncbi:MAG: DUF370 domain-containing protein [Clostridia bacterium]|nr:DUF370 domain-containing protein [Clostridia bacterium]
MYIYLGENTVVHSRDVVGIFDIETTTLAANTRRFLADAEKGRRVTEVSAGQLPRSFVVCAEKDGSETVYLSQLATATLKKRAAIL